MSSTVSKVGSGRTSTRGYLDLRVYGSASPVQVSYTVSDRKKPPCKYSLTGRGLSVTRRLAATLRCLLRSKDPDPDHCLRTKAVCVSLLVRASELAFREVQLSHHHLLIDT